MKIATLTENTIPRGSMLEARHGLGLYIETETMRLLFDCGPDESFVRNADALDIDISTVDAVVLSHAHYDHGGGLRAFFAMNDHAPIYLLEAAKNKYYSISRSPVFRYIGLDSDLFEEYNERFIFFSASIDVSDSVHLFAVGEYNTFHPRFNSLLYKEKEGKMLPDDFTHELVMAVTEHSINTVFTGCAHSGILNMVHTVLEQIPAIPIHTLVGGFHLINTATKTLGETPETVWMLAKELDRLGISRVYTGHCTGEEGFRNLQAIFGARIEALYTGKRFATA
ncbi:MBL fold metallo-hydrolase [Microbacter margulisiae]|uniref:7, 8-dihydropterin-6-yl-methyl-4-(Beta-D-ribofuranosyl)aminobenzene 5'-phosphate synthase n=1 Tax=Microbacter margulisiae TaxID=1350067 RepID=A0A7W5DP74_9PORP|nr:MBL fold metallo-hydrolase [Microbacter margulisiae]MBB3186391.1 7,8-dihydropterin-6-yl-methyl-4-(beta-D-ribofuranosyl)aminobenzene 5'-phosphate synthase [Microbacter margulisiae]